MKISHCRQRTKQERLKQNVLKHTHNGHIYIFKISQLSGTRDTLAFQASPLLVMHGTLMIYEALATYIRDGYPIRVKALRIRGPRQSPS